MKVYLAGPLFTVAERKFNSSLSYELHALNSRGPRAEEIDDFECLVPQVFTRDVRLEEVAEQCIFELRRSDVVLVNCDGPDVDSGTSFEAGYAVCLTPRIPVIAYRTDFRKAGDDITGRSVNLMIGQYATHFIQCEPLESVKPLARELLVHLRKLGE